MPVTGIPIDAVDMPGAVSRMMSAAGSPTTLHVCTVNLHFLVTAQRDPEVRAILRSSGLNLADGAPVLWLARLLGHRLPGRVTGADLLPALMSAAAAAGARVFLLGGEAECVAEARRRLERRHPGLVVCGTYQPPVTAVERMESDDILRHVAASRADILLVALGHPKQERWIARNRARLTVGVAVGVGCSLELVAGRRSRAPRWMQDRGMEWLYRLAHEPRRLLPRYAAGAGWLLLVLVPRALSAR